MKLLTAILSHTWHVLSLKHDGAGLPTKRPAAFVLTSLYVLLSLANRHIGQGITLETLLGLCFIAQVYIFILRIKLIGLFILIGIIINALSLIFSALFGVPDEQFLTLLIAEYIMIFAALINNIKSSVKAI
jgi:hypothetical protein